MLSGGLARVGNDDDDDDGVGAVVAGVVVVVVVVVVGVGVGRVAESSRPSEVVRVVESVGR